MLPALPAASSTRAGLDRGAVARRVSPLDLGREGVPWDLAARVPEFYAGGPYDGHGEANQLVLAPLRLRPLDVRVGQHLGGEHADQFRVGQRPWPSTLSSGFQRASRGDSAHRPDGAGARALLLVSLSRLPNPALHQTRPRSLFPVARRLAVVADWYH